MLLDSVIEQGQSGKDDVVTVGRNLRQQHLESRPAGALYGFGQAPTSGGQAQDARSAVVLARQLSNAIIAEQALHQTCDVALVDAEDARQVVLPGRIVCALSLE
ncbi:MAG TPA: hypothetical protein VNO55_11350 [Polyangia bacterium]|nr:hypothetical protein [Polyangia bacterium]